MPRATDRQRRALLRCIAETRKHLGEIGMSDAAARVAYCLFRDWRPWPISAIAESTGLSRMTVRKTLRRWEAEGYAVPDRRGWRITDAGVAYVRTFADELVAANRAGLVAFCATL